MRSLLILLLVLGTGACSTTGQLRGPGSQNRDESTATDVEQRFATHLMFTGQAEEAMRSYVSLFEDGEITSLQRYGPGEQGREGTVMRATFRLGEQEFLVIDSPPVHDFTFTPSMSIYVACEDREEFDRIFEALSGEGQVMMPPDDYGFSTRFAWCIDRFGVSWQLELP